MSRRKDELKALLSGAPAREPQADASRSEGAGETEARPERAASGAVKAMGLALGNLRAGAEEARGLRETLARGERVVELDPARIEPAFVADRLSRAETGDESFEALKASIAQGGQQVPVLVRPHPDPAKAGAGRFQAAYGHRRIAAAAALGITVRAVVRTLDDEELVLAQGQENSERRDLSFIERALFAKALLDHGFDRATVQRALGFHKSDMTRFLQVAEAVPDHVARAIGPAPRAGRPRWLALAEHLKGEANRVKAQDEMMSERFRRAGSDERFVLLFARMSRAGAPPSGSGGEDVAGEGGERIAALRRRGRAVTIEIAAGGFADFVAAELPALHAAYRRREAGED